MHQHAIQFSKMHENAAWVVYFNKCSINLIFTLALALPPAFTLVPTIAPALQEHQYHHQQVQLHFWTISCNLPGTFSFYFWVPGPAPSWVSQRSLHNAPIFRLLLKVAVNGTHQCDLLNFWGTSVPTIYREALWAHWWIRNRMGSLFLFKLSRRLYLHRITASVTPLVLMLKSELHSFPDDAK